MLTAERIRELAPAAFTTAEQSIMSARYSAVCTMDVVERLMGEGFHPIAAKQDRPTRRSPAHVRHTIVMRHETTSAPEVGGIVPQLLLTNSHNGRTKLSLRAGLYRFICANGLVVGDDKFSEALIHRADAGVAAVDFAQRLAANLSALTAVQDEWAQVPLRTLDREQFARAAAERRWGSMRAGQYTPDQILTPRRPEDAGEDLCTTYNVVQENLVKGGMEGKTASGRRVVSRGIKAIGEDLSFNEWLWSLASEYATGQDSTAARELADS